MANRLDMKVKQKTFSVAMSRDMVPSARLLAYYIYDGEVVSDCLNFFVNGTRQNTVSTDHSSHHALLKQLRHTLLVLNRSSSSLNLYCATDL